MASGVFRGGRTAVGTLLAALALATVAAPAQAACSSNVDTFTITSRFVDPAKAQFNGAPGPCNTGPLNKLNVDVLLPPGYASNPTQTYPVLYLLHGHGDAYSSWLAPTKGNLQALLPANFNGVVVMPDAAQGWYTNWWDSGARGSDGRAWERYFEEELVPYVESHYRITAGRSNHAIAGLSMGGEGAMFFAEMMPGYFGSAASFSGTISIQRTEWPQGFNTQGQNYADVHGDPSNQYSYWRGHNPTGLTANAAHTRLFVRVGDGTPYPYTMQEATNYFGIIAETELHQHANDFGTAAGANNPNLRYEPVSGVHDWPYWRDALTSALHWGFFNPVADSYSQWSYETIANQGNAWGIGYSFDTPTPATVTFTRNGSALSANDGGAVPGHPLYVTLTGVPGAPGPLHLQLPFTIYPF